MLVRAGYAHDDGSSVCRGLHYNSCEFMCVIYSKYSRQARVILGA